MWKREPLCHSEVSELSSILFGNTFYPLIWLQWFCQKLQFRKCTPCSGNVWCMVTRIKNTTAAYRGNESPAFKSTVCRREEFYTKTCFPDYHGAVRSARTRNEPKQLHSSRQLDTKITCSGGCDFLWGEKATRDFAKQNGTNLPPVSWKRTRTTADVKDRISSSRPVRYQVVSDTSIEPWPCFCRRRKMLMEVLPASATCAPLMFHFLSQCLGPLCAKGVLPKRLCWQI